MIICFLIPNVNLVMPSEDPMGHTQSTNDKQSSQKPFQRVIGYLTCFMC